MIRTVQACAIFSNDGVTSISINIYLEPHSHSIDVKCALSAFINGNSDGSYVRAFNMPLPYKLNLNLN